MTPGSFLSFSYFSPSRADAVILFSLSDRSQIMYVPRGSSIIEWLGDSLVD